MVDCRCDSETESGLVKLAWINSTTGSLDLNQNALGILRALPGPLCVLGVTTSRTSCQSGLDGVDLHNSLWMSVHYAGGSGYGRTVVVLCTESRTGIPVGRDASQSQLSIFAFLLLSSCTIAHLRCASTLYFVLPFLRISHKKTLV